VGGESMCATRRNDGMSGKLLRLYRQALSPWGVASGGCKPEVKELPCATRRIDGMRGNLLDLYRQVVSPWAVAP
jgi:hypothetical protein